MPCERGAAGRGGLHRGDPRGGAAARHRGARRRAPCRALPHRTRPAVGARPSPRGRPHPRRGRRCAGGRARLPGRLRQRRPAAGACGARLRRHARRGALAHQPLGRAPRGAERERGARLRHPRRRQLQGCRQRPPLPHPLGAGRAARPAARARRAVPRHAGGLAQLLRGGSRLRDRARSTGGAGDGPRAGARAGARRAVAQRRAARAAAGGAVAARDHRPFSRAAFGLRRAAALRERRRASAAARRDGHRQGALRSRLRRRERARRRCLGAGADPGALAHARRVGAVRPRARRLHRGEPRQEGPARDRRRRGPVPRRGRRHRPRAAAEAAALPRLGRALSGGRHGGATGRCPRGLRHEPAARARRAAGTLPCRPAGPARADHRGPAAARAA